jgi:glycosyltransferase involved in cell wall biosynthesis
MARIVRFFRRIRVAVDVRDVWPEGLPGQNDFRVRAFSRYCNVLNWLGRGVGDVYLYTAPGFLEWIDKWAAGKPRHFIPLGYDDSRWEDKEPVPEYSSDIIRLVFIGELVKTMNIVPLVRAVANRPEYSLTLIGGGDPDSNLQKAILELEPNNVEFLGRLSQHEVVEKIDSFHVCVIPMTTRYAMPNKLFDAIAAMRPILVFGENDAARLVREHEIGWALPFDTATTKKFLDQLTSAQVVAKSQNLLKIRKRFSQSHLYEDACRLIYKSL